MLITVKFFAGYRDLVKTDKLELDLPDKTTGEELLGYLIKRCPPLERIKTIARLAVNLEFKPMNSVLSDKDEVVFIAPVCGG